MRQQNLSVIGDKADLHDRSAALAVDNAQLYQEAQQLNAELEQRVRERTALLQANNERLQQQIADRLRAEAELAEVRQQLAQHGEDQRLQLAKQLHDGPVQDLYGISYRLASLNDTLADQWSGGSGKSGIRVRIQS